MRFPFALASVLLGTCLIADQAAPCSLRVSPPETFTVATPDAEFVLAVIRPQSRYADGAEQQIRQRYPRSGVYLAGRAPELVWTLPDDSGAIEAHSFFSQEGRVHLVLSQNERLLFYEDGVLTKEFREREFVSAPWHGSVAHCGPDLNLEIEGSSLGRNPTVTVTTTEGSEFVFDSKSTELISERRPMELNSTAPSTEERKLAQFVSDVFAMGKVGNFGAAFHELTTRLPATVLMSCNPEWVPTVQAADAAPPVDPEEAVVIRTLLDTAIPVKTDVFGLQRLRIPDAGFSAYRVPDGEAIRTLCGIEPLPTALLAAGLAEGDSEPTDRYHDLAAALNGPTVIVALVMEAPAELEEGRLIGLASLWSDTEEGWKLIAFHPFDPQEE